MTERHKILLAVYLVLIRRDKVLLSRRANTGYMDGQFSLPSGHVEAKEGALKALVREAKEEINIDIATQDIKLAHTMHRNIEPDDRQGYEYVDLYFVCNKWLGEPKNVEPEKCSEITWFSIDNLPDDMISEVEQALLEINKSSNYSEFKF
jgi:8-oxo-dGTP diphosphatase